MTQQEYNPIVYYPTLAKGLLNEVSYSYCEISRLMYDATKEYHVDILIILRTPDKLGTVLKIKNGELLYSRL